MKKTIAIQVIIFIATWFIMTPDVLEDNTHVFGLFGSYDLVRGNAHWVLAGAAILSIINILIWWPRQVKVANTVKESKGDKSAEAKAEEAKDKDPIVPKMD